MTAGHERILSTKTMVSGIRLVLGLRTSTWDPRVYAVFEGPYHCECISGGRFPRESSVHIYEFIHTTRGSKGPKYGACSMLGTVIMVLGTYLLFGSLDR